MTRTTQLTILVILFSFILRLPLLDGSFWLDEAAQALESSRPFTQQLDIAYDFQPPLMHVLLHFVMHVSHKEVWMRFWLALVPALISLYLTIGIGRKILGEKGGLLAGLLLGVSSFHIYFSQELRPYSLPALFATVTWYYLIVDESSWKSKKLHWRFVAATAAGLYSSYLYPFVLLGQLAYGVIQTSKQTKKKILSSIALASIAFLPWLPKFFEQLQVGGALRQNLPGWEDVVSIPQLKAIPLTFGKFIYGVLDISLTPFFVGTLALLVVLFCIGIFTILTTQNTHKKQFIILAVFWFGIPLLSAWLLSFIVPVVQPKRMLLIQPAWMLILASLITTLLSQKKFFMKNVGKILLGSLLSISMISTAAYYTDTRLQRENWKHLHATILQEYPKKSIAVFSFPEPFAPWTWYDRTNYPKLSTGVIHVSQLNDLSNTLKSVTNYDTVLVFDYLRDLTDPDDQILATMRGFGYTEVGAITYPGIGFVRIYSTKMVRLSGSL